MLLLLLICQMHTSCFHTFLLNNSLFCFPVQTNLTVSSLRKSKLYWTLTPNIIRNIKLVVFSGGAAGGADMFFRVLLAGMYKHVYYVPLPGKYTLWSWLLDTYISSLPCQVSTNSISSYYCTTHVRQCQWFTQLNRCTVNITIGRLTSHGIHKCAFPHSSYRHIITWIQN